MISEDVKDFAAAPWQKIYFMSETIADWLANNKTNKGCFVKELILRGKEKETQVYEVNKPGELV